MLIAQAPYETSTNETLDEAAALFDTFSQITSEAQSGTTTVILNPQAPAQAMNFTYREPAVFVLLLFFIGSIIALLLIRKGLKRAVHAGITSRGEPSFDRDVGPPVKEAAAPARTALVQPGKLVKIKVRKIRKKPHYAS